ncbi:MAG: hypothetical protein CL557_12310 [Alphaproteobacteria bacterium]|nr:hypothetical protein [Alphaproteobacteria bacterium]|tara:strand:- start:1746 stop:1985 length:240 start_codon:yes stop_codon:yes gene_type:complete
MRKVNQIITQENGDVLQDITPQAGRITKEMVVNWVSDTTGVVPPNKLLDLIVDIANDEYPLEELRYDIVTSHFNTHEEA